MPQFRKKPVVIEARQLTFENGAEIMAWCGSTQHWSRPPMRAVTGIIVPTLEGQHEAAFGDWIVKGIKGEFHPVKPDIFAATYASATSDESETGWLAEIVSNTGPSWWSLTETEGDGGYFTKDSLKALRFARKEDAQAYIDDAGWTEVIPTEHQWG